MTEPPAPERIAALWSPEARADLRSIDREVAMQILQCLDGYLPSRAGDVKKLKPRCGDYRVFFDLKNDNAMGVTAVRHRKEAYR